jgi:pimeloyl-ACP methyl ester carboxylesterase
MGKAELTITVNDLPINVFTYRPKSYKDGPLILVLHGILRNADEYRDHAAVMGDRFQALIAAPKFDEERFPKPKYQFAGVVNGDGEALPADQRTGAYLSKIAADLRHREKRSDMPFYVIGHSAGGQFLARSSAFVTIGAKRIIAANPGTQLFPSRDADYPLGFGKLPQSLASDDQLQHYLAQPLTMYLGSADTERDEYLDVLPENDRQGRTRWERGRNAFFAAKELAEKKGWKFHWRLVVAEGVAHDHEKMFHHSAVKDALFGE